MTRSDKHLDDGTPSQPAARNRDSRGGRDVEFERSVAELLRARGDVQPEILIGHKKVDLLLEDRRFGKTRRTAVECKNYSGRLTQAQVNTIYTNYRTLYDNNQIDEILIVTHSGLAPSALRLVEDTRALSHMTYADLQATVLDFAGYLRGLRNHYLHETDGLPDYYVPARTGDDDLLELVLAWIARTETPPPMAILGSYGLGKTSFAEHLSYVLGERHADDSSARIPVLLRLSDISAEQTLEGLLGRALTATSPVPGYSFDAFMQLARSGQFVLILDGFDEMKRTLTWEEFKYNLAQLNRLISGDNRVVLLGRPTAFLSDAEYRFALHGIRSVRDTMIKDADWPDYIEVEIAPFSPEQIAEFLDGYLAHKSTIPDARALAGATSRTITKRILETNVADLARRPVQLKMLVEILPTYKGDIEDLDRALLYDLFIDRIIERDAEKLARRRFRVRDRRRFAQELAWWLWADSRGLHVTPETIPSTLIQSFCGHDDDEEAVRRDLVSACFLERRLGGVLAFPHRSFMEFLVAEGCLARLVSSNASLDELNEVVSPDIGDFIAGIAGHNEIARAAEQLHHYQGALSRSIAKLWWVDGGRGLAARARQPISPWYPLLLTVGICEGAVQEGLLDPVELKAQIPLTEDGRHILVLLLCAIALAHRRGDETLIGETLRAASIVGSRRQARRIELDALEQHVLIGNRLVSLAATDGEVVTVISPNQVIANVMTQVHFHDRLGAIDLRDVYPQIACALADYCVLHNDLHPTDDGRMLIKSLGLPGLVQVADGEAVVDQLQRYAGTVLAFPAGDRRL
jgi:hypothetical protein